MPQASTTRQDTRRRKNLSGIVPPLVTPFLMDGTIDVESLVRLIEYQIDNGVHGLFLFGSSGEGPALTDRQRDVVIKVAVEAVNSRLPVIVGVMDTSVDRVIEKAKRISEFPLDGLVVTPPFYHRISQPEIADHFRMIRDSVDMPIYAYDIPSLVKVKLQPETVVKLAREGVIAGLKDSSGDYQGLRYTIMATKGIEGFAVLTGMEFLVDIGVQMGCHGAIPGLANVAPREYVELYDASINKRWDQARELQHKLIELFDITKVEVEGASYSARALSAFKAALKLKGVLSTSRMADPMRCLDHSAESEVAKIMTRAGFLVEGGGAQ